MNSPSDNPAEMAASRLLSTERLELFLLSLADAPMILSLLNEPSFIANIGDRQVRNLAQAQQYLLNGPLASYQQHGFGLYKVVLKETLEPIGLCGLVKRDFLAAPDLGYALFPAYCGKGLATEATRAVYAYAKQELALSQVMAIVLASNQPSVRVLENVGLKRAGQIQSPQTLELLDLYVENN